MECLSVREESGADIIKEITGRNAIVLVDPTMMLSKDKWLSVSTADINKPKKEYLLTYFLGKTSRNVIDFIEQIATDNKLSVVRLGDRKDKARFIAGPSEFIDYINSATVIFTDSFHGVIFSILLEKPFVVFERVGDFLSMNSRIETLLSKFNLKLRKWENIKDDQNFFHLDYSQVAPILKSEREKALNYLIKALNFKDNN